MLKISVIMGVYNTNNIEMLRKSITSILDQTYPNFEFIICDDGSTDNTMDLIKTIVKDDKRVKLIKNDKNMGLAYTLNHCIEKAHGEYIARMDADDYSEKERFQKQIDFLENNKEYSVVGSNVALFDEKGIWGERSLPEIIEKEDFLFTSPFMHPTVMMRKKDLKNVNNYRVAKETLRAEDYDLWMRMYAKGYKLYNLQEKLFQVREDKDCFKRRKYKYRIGEAKVRYNGFKELQLFPKGYIYVIKPFIVGLIPQRILKIIRKKREKINAE